MDIMLQLYFLIISEIFRIFSHAQQCCDIFVDRKLDGYNLTGSLPAAPILNLTELTVL